MLHTPPHREYLQEAMREWGTDVVNEALQLVNVSDPDGAYTTFEDQGLYEHADCVGFLYFGDDYFHI